MQPRAFDRGFTAATSERPVAIRERESTRAATPPDLWVLCRARLWLIGVWTRR